jgi:hypothetical protein
MAFSRGGHTGKFDSPDKAKFRSHQGFHFQGTGNGIVVGDGKGSDSGFFQILKQKGRGVGTVGGGGVDVQINGICHGSTSRMFGLLYHISPKKQSGQRDNWRSG